VTDSCEKENEASLDVQNTRNFVTSSATVAFL
jgi:hypothetical protein